LVEKLDRQGFEICIYQKLDFQASKGLDKFNIWLIIDICKTLKGGVVMVKVKLNPDLAVLAKLEDLSVKELGKYKLICPKYVWVPLSVGIYTDTVVAVKQENIIVMEEKKGWTTVWLNAEPSKWEIEVSEDSYSIVAYDGGLFITLPADGYMIATRSDGKTYRINLKEGTSDTRFTYEELTALIKALK